MIDTAFLAFLIALTVSVLLTPLIIFLYKKKGWVETHTTADHPKHLHDRPVPRGGGIPIFIAIAVASIALLPLDKHLIGILTGAFIITIIGILDDRFDLHPILRLIVGFMAAACVVLAGIGIPYVSNPLGAGLIYLNQPQLAINLFGSTHTLWLIADLFAFIWIVGLMNFVNWSKGLDGQLPGFVAIAALVIALLSQRYSADITQWQTGLLAMIIAGAFLGFLPWNFFPQKIMPGYGGGALAGFFLAVLAILSTTKVNTLIITLSLPLIDAFYVVIRRVLSGKSPLWGDTRHLHHTLYSLGWGKRRIAILYWISAAIMGIFALRLNSQQKFYTIIGAVIIFGFILLWIKRLLTSSLQPDRDNGSKI